MKLQCPHCLMRRAKDLRFLWPTESLSGRLDKWGERLLGKKNSVFGFLSCLLARPRVQFDTVNRCDCVCAVWVKDKKHWRRKKREEKRRQKLPLLDVSHPLFSRQRVNMKRAGGNNGRVAHLSPFHYQLLGVFSFLRGYGKSPKIGWALRYGGHGNRDEWEPQLNRKMHRGGTLPGLHTLSYVSQFYSFLSLFFYL